MFSTFKMRIAGGRSSITGTAFPAETLTSTQAGQWYADDVAIIGETGSTYSVRLSDIGKTIRQINSNSVTIWKPGDIAGVVRFWSSLSNVLNSVSPDVAATDGQSVRRWNSVISTTQANQTDGTFQPIYRSTGQSGNPSLEFDGSNDRFELPSNTDVFQNKSQGYLFAGVRDTNPTGGAATHFSLFYSVGTSTATRLGLATRGGGGNNFVANARRLDGDALTAATAANNSNYNVLGTHGDWSNGFVRLRVNGSVSASTALPSSGSTSNTASQVAIIGTDAGGTLFFPGHITCVCVVNSSLTATQVSQIERYIGLFGNLNIPLV